MWPFMVKYFMRYDEVLSPDDSPCCCLLDLQISHRCESYELQRFPQLRRRIEEVVASFLREGLAPAETMIGHLIEMEVTNFSCRGSWFAGMLDVVLCTGTSSVEI